MWRCFFRWLHRNEWRQIEEEERRILAMSKRIDERIAQLFTPDEWREVCERNERKMRDLGY